MGGQFKIYRDDLRRLAAEIAPGVIVAFKLLSEDSDRRLDDDCRAFIVVDIDTPIGWMRARQAEISWSKSSGSSEGKLVVRWPQFTSPARGSVPGRTLDVFGPLGRPDRRRINGIILSLYRQILFESKNGTLGQSLKANSSQEQEIQTRMIAENAKPEEEQTTSLAAVQGGEGLAAIQKALTIAENTSVEHVSVHGVDDEVEFVDEDGSNPTD